MSRDRDIDNDVFSISLYSEIHLRNLALPYTCWDICWYKDYHLKQHSTYTTEKASKFKTKGLSSSTESRSPKTFHCVLKYQLCLNSTVHNSSCFIRRVKHFTMSCKGAAFHIPSHDHKFSRRDLGSFSFHGLVQASNTFFFPSSLKEIPNDQMSNIRHFQDPIFIISGFIVMLCLCGYSNTTTIFATNSFVSALVKIIGHSTSSRFCSNSFESNFILGGNICHVTDPLDVLTANIVSSASRSEEGKDGLMQTKLKAYEWVDSLVFSQDGLHDLFPPPNHALFMMTVW